jgi:hypothetical protein
MARKRLGCEDECDGHRRHKANTFDTEGANGDGGK